MSDLTRNTQVFRAALVALALAYALISIISTIRTAGSTTDENIFADTPSRIYFTKNHSALSDVPSFRNRLQDNNLADVFIAGDVLVRLNGVRVEGLNQVIQIINQTAGDSTVEMEVFRPYANEKFVREIAMDDLPSPLEFLRIIPHTVYILQVTEGGASDRAGLRRGDVITRINNQYFTSAIEADRILKSIDQDAPIKYEVLRANVKYQFPVTLAKIGVSIIDLIRTMVAILYIAVGLFIGLARPALMGARLTGVGFVLLGGFFALFFGSPGINPFLDTLIIILSHIGWHIGIVVSWHSSLYLPKERSAVLAQRWTTVFPYVLASIVTVFIIVQALFGSINFLYTFGWALIGVFLSVFLVYALFVSLRFHHTRTTEEKRMNAPIRYAFYNAVIVYIITMVAVNNFDIAFEPFLYWCIALAFVPVAVLYVILKHRLLAFEMRLRRNLQYSIISGAMITTLVAVWGAGLYGLSELDIQLPQIYLTSTTLEISQRMPAGTGQSGGLLFSMILAIGFSYALWRVDRYGQSLLDRIYHRSAYDYRRSVDDFAGMMITKLNLHDLLNSIVQKLAELMQIKRVGILIFDNEKTITGNEAEGFKDEKWRRLCSELDDRFIRAVRQFQREFTVDYLSGGVKELFRENNVHFLVPIRSKLKLIGVLLIGEKRSEAVFNREDLDFMNSVAKQASAAIENAFLYERLAEQERLKHELQIARTIQLSSLPQETPSVDRLDISGYSIPAHEVGGDFFDYLGVERNSVFVVAGDVSGKGASAALYMLKIQGIMRSLSGFDLSPAELLARANALIHKDLAKGAFVTVIGLAFDTTARTFVLARAGHIPLLHYRLAADEVCSVAPQGIGMGLVHSNMFRQQLEERTQAYDPGDVFLMITDGVTEARNAEGHEYGDERLQEIFHRHAHDSADDIRAAIEKDIRFFCDGAFQHDDLTIVVVKAT